MPPLLAEKTPNGLTAKVTTIDAKGTSAAAVVSNALELEDEFRLLYHDVALANGRRVIEPPYNFYQLEKLSQENNALLPCIAAMITNVDGTGYEIEPDDPDKSKDADPKITELEQFFDEVYPNTSFMAMRKKLRKDLESTGNAYMEVLRNAEGKLVFLRHVESKMVRMIELDAPVQVERTVMRGGTELTVTMAVRERRFAMKTSSDAKIVFFKEHTASRDLDKTNGTWAKEGETLPVESRATELIHFVCERDLRTPYGVPRWVNQIPSVIGSRASEEHNLAFFDSGGIPPMLITVQGGSLTEEAKVALDQAINGKTKNKHRAAVLEAFSTSGAIDSAGSVRVTIERFGAERQQDSMFEGYDERCEIRVRRAFRLPPIFVGSAAEYSFASAFTSYTVAEAQIFAPERQEFDEIITNRILPEIDGKDYTFRSKPLTVKDVTQQLQAIQIAQTASAIDAEQLVDQLNEITSLSLKFSQETVDAANALVLAQIPKPTGPGIESKPFEMPEKPPPKPAAPGPGIATKPFEMPTPANAEAKGPNAPPRPSSAAGYTGTRMKKEEAKGDQGEDAERLIGLAQSFTEAVRKRDFEAIGQIHLETASLTPREERLYKQLLAMNQFADTSLDPEGLGELAGCTLAVVAANRQD
jgi:PBSX family phage portal protein